MKHISQKFIAVLLCGLVLVSSISPAYAAGSSYANPKQSTFWDWLFSTNVDLSHFGGGRFTGPQQGGSFRGLYDDYVSDLPASGYGSDGVLYLNIPWYWSNYSEFDVSSSVSGDITNLVIVPGKTIGSYRFNLRYQIEAPITGTYQIIRGISMDQVSIYYLRSGTPTYLTFSSSNFNNKVDGLYVAGTTLSYISQDSCYPGMGYGATYYARWPTYVICKVVPSNDFWAHGGDVNYSNNTRTGVINGGLGIIGDNGTITDCNNNYVFDETSNTYYNPITDSYNTVTNWTYDYSDRSYHLTLENGDTITVTYGDENITINEGDTIYNVYYIIDGDGTGGGSGDNHKHSYTSSVTREPSCTVPGSRLYTCSECGNSYTESIPAPGHTWEVKDSVTTEYDDEGNLVQEGYTIYKCSVCGEEYKSTDGTSPPSGGSPGGGSISGTSGLFTGIFGLLWDFCAFMIALFNDFVIGGVGAFLGAIVDGVGDFFGILNPINWFD